MKRKVILLVVAITLLVSTGLGCVPKQTNTTAAQLQESIQSLEAKVAMQDEKISNLQLDIKRLEAVIEELR